VILRHLFLLLLFSGLATGYQWLDTGVYFTYTALSNSTSNWTVPHAPSTVVLVYNVSGVPVAIHYRGNVTVTFRILNVSGDLARVELNVLGTRAVVKSPEGVEPFWDVDDVVASDRGLTYLKELSLGCLYLVNLSDGSVYDTEGGYYGRTLLWYQPDLEEGDYLFRSPGGLDVTVMRVETLNETVLTFYRPFKPPVVMVLTGPFSVKLSDFEAGGRAMVFYDPATGFLLSFMGVVWADFQACGFLTLMGSTQVFPEGEGLKLGGLLLTDTNAESSTGLVEYRTYTSQLVYLYILVALIVIWRVLK